MNIEEFKDQPMGYDNEFYRDRPMRFPIVTKENQEQYIEWLRRTEELGIGFGKYA